MKFEDLEFLTEQFKDVQAADPLSVRLYARSVKKLIAVVKAAKNLDLSMTPIGTYIPGLCVFKMALEELEE